MNVIDSCLSLDHKSVELWDLVGTRDWSSDYVDGDVLNGFEHERTVPLPEALLDTYRQCECAMFTGLLPEINRAWISVDDRLFLWNYEDGRDFCVYDGVDQVIVSVGLVRAKPQLFVDDVKYLLLVATPVEVVVLAVSFGQNLINGELTLHPTELSVPSDNVHMLCMAGTADGRAFMGGSDGNLYELDYAADNSWLAHRPLKCQKVNRSATVLGTLVPTFLKYLLTQGEDPLKQIVVDDTRGVLYTLSERSRIECRKVSGGIAELMPNTSGESSSRTSSAPLVAALDAHQWQRQASALCPRVSDADLQLTSIHAVPVDASGHVCLIAMSARGTRLFFTTHKVESWSAAEHGALAPPKTLRLIHVRLPPSAPMDAGEPRAGNGVTPACSDVRHSAQPLTRGADADSLVLVGDVWGATGAGVNHDNTSSENATFRECVEVVPLDARVLSLSMAAAPPLADPYLASSQARRSSLAPLVLSDVPTGVPLGSSLSRHSNATAHIAPPQRMLCLSGGGLVVLRRRTPLAALATLLQRAAANGVQSRDLAQFFALHGAVETAAMCVALATSPPPSSSVETGLRRAGTMPALAQHVGPLANVKPVTDDVVSLAMTALARYGGQPVLKQRTAAPVTAAVGRAVVDAEISFSATHDGLALYLARRLRPLWRHPIAVTSRARLNELATSADGMVVRSRLPASALEFVERPLRALASLLETERLAAPPPRDASRADAARAELNSLKSMKETLNAALDAIAFWRTLVEHDFTRIAARLTDTDRQNLMATVFRDLVVSSGNVRRDAGRRDEGVGLVSSAVASASAATNSNDTLEGGNMARVLLNELIASHSETGQSVEHLSNQLRERCPTLFVEADRTRFTAHELLAAARVTSAHSRERAALVEKAVQRFCAVAATVNVRAVCRALCALRAHDGAVEVVLAHAAAIDPQRRAVRAHVVADSKLASSSSSSSSLMSNGALNTPGGAAGTSAAYAHANASEESLRQQCLAAYACAFDGLDELLLARETESDDEARARLDAQWQRARARAASADDELFHYVFYDWLRRPGANGRASLEQELLALDTAYLETYLKAASVDLLCRYYIRVGKLDAAALVLTKLAERRGGDMTLEERIGNLARAQGCLAQCRSPQAAALATEVREKLEVAQLQLRARRTLAARANDGDSAAARRVVELDNSLLTISELFNRHAKPCQLWDLQLAIMHCAGHADAALGRRVWTALIRDAAPTLSNAALAERVVTLARAHYPNNVTFPLEHVVLLLERLSLARRVAEADADEAAFHARQHDDNDTHPDASARAAPPLWVPRTLAAGGVAWPILFGVYDALLTRAERDPALISETPLRPHLLRVQSLLVEQWLSAEAAPDRALDAAGADLEQYVVAAQSLSPSAIQEAKLVRDEATLIAERFRRWM